MTRHTRTDPACEVFRPPRFWWQRWRFDRARGRACQVCSHHYDPDTYRCTCGELDHPEWGVSA